MRIFLVRHGESEGNVDRSTHKRVADHAINLSPRGVEQALRAGEALFEYYSGRFGSYGLAASGKVPARLWCSPYNRTRQTADAIVEALSRKKVAVEEGRRESVNLCEQQFGLFDGLSDEELRAQYPNEFAHYKKAEDSGGRFWARMPLGESRFDVALRVHNFFGTIQRDLERHRIDDLIIVSHGNTIRAFIMRWLGLPYEWFEKEPNPKNGSIRLLVDLNDRGYIHEGE